MPKRLSLTTTKSKLHLFPGRDIFDGLEDLPLADLLITSPPVKMITEPLLQILLAQMHPAGTLLIDAPFEHHAKIQAWLEPHGWILRHVCKAQEMYPGVDQGTVVFTPKNYVEGMRAVARDFTLRSTNRSHPCEFSQYFIQEMIRTYSRSNQIVMDPMCGTGMVPKVASDMFRYGIGVDIRETI